MLHGNFRREFKSVRNRRPKAVNDKAVEEEEEEEAAEEEEDVFVVVVVVNSR